ncbi:MULTISPECIES: hypothetical protein [unclassified Paenibacillus]|uniref:hypothetical protein n=1 Tax=unclassified Paenibacillus TaxID=185978 RepID=UPI003635F068
MAEKLRFDDPGGFERSKEFRYSISLPQSKAIAETGIPLCWANRSIMHKIRAITELAVPVSL